jgi:acyl phosphate:glycerol-3-phosphate acyltransferase
MIISILLTIASYLIGSLSAAIIVSKLMSLPDPRTLGSRNPGATNVLRLAGKKAASLVLLGDILKGFVPLVVAQALHVEENVMAAVGLAAFLGHLYPIYFGFHGGKGVATALGILLGLAWPLAAVVLATWLFIAKLFHVSSLSAIMAAIMAPFYTWWLLDSPPKLIMVIIISTMLLWRHRGNIQRLFKGAEAKIGQ